MSNIQFHYPVCFHYSLQSIITTVIILGSRDIQNMQTSNTNLRILIQYVIQKNLFSSNDSLHYFLVVMYIRVTVSEKETTFVYHREDRYQKQRETME